MSISGDHASVDTTMTNPGQISSLLNDLQNAITLFVNEPNQTTFNGNFEYLELNAGIYQVNALYLDNNDELLLKGSESDVFIFNITTNFNIEDNAKITLEGVLPKNIYWNVGNDISILSGTEVYGNLIASNELVFNDYVHGEHALYAINNLTIENNRNIKSLGVQTPIDSLPPLNCNTNFGCDNCNLLFNGNFDDTLELGFQTLLTRQYSWQSSGSYHIINNAKNYDTALANISDHTRTAGPGYFLFVDGFTEDNKPPNNKKLILAQRKNIQYAQLNYRLSLWMTHLNNEEPPQQTTLGVYINGVVVDTLFLRRTIGWQEYCVDWFANADTAFIELVQLDTAYWATDANYGIDDIRFLITDTCNYSVFESIPQGEFNTLITCYDDHTYIGTPAFTNNCFNRTYEWFPKINLDNYYSPYTLIYANPSNLPDTTKYLLKITQNNIVVYDTVTVIRLPQFILGNLPTLPIELSTNSSETISNNLQPMGGSGSYSYSWTPTVGLINPNIANPTVNLPPGGPYTYTVKVKSGECFKEYIQEIYVYPTYSNYNQNACTENVNYTWNNFTPTAPVSHIPSDQIVRGTIRVPSGKTLIFNGRNLKFGIAGKIIVERGGHLKLNNCILEGLNSDATNSPCYSMWEGIEVWGDETKTHIGVDTLSQGKITISGTTEINDAHVAVYLGKRPEFPNFGITVEGYGGGILKSQDAKYRRNGIDVEYAAYNPIYTTNEGPSRLVSNQFLGGTLKDPGYKIGNSVGAPTYPNPSKPYYGLKNQLGRTTKHIKLYAQPQTIHMFNNFFDNAELGVDAIDASIKLINADNNVTSFSNHNIGIYLINSSNSALYTIQIERNKFNKNNIGISLNNALSINVDSNVFGSSLIPQSNQLDNPIGIQLYYCSDFSLLNNSFYRCEAGITISNSGSIGGIIAGAGSGNVFNRCNYGVVATGDNSNLKIRCNTFNNNAALPSEYFSRNWQITGQLANQGSVANNTTPAGNEFFPETRKHIYSNANFQYFRHKWGMSGASDTAVKPLVAAGSSGFTWNKIVNTGFAKTNASCDYAVPPCNPDCDAPLENNRQQLALLNTDLQSLETEIDSGNSMEVYTTLQSSSLNSGKLMQYLLNHSPLSEQNMSILAINSQKLNQGHLLQVLEKNLPTSDSTFNDLLNNLTYLNKAKFNAIIDLQENNTNSKTKEKLKRKKQNLENERNELIASQVRIKIKKGQLDQAYQIMLQEEGAFKEAAISTMISKGEFERAATEFFNYRSSDQTWDDFQQIAIALHSAGKSWYHLDTLTKRDLVTLENLPGNGSVSSKAIHHLLDGTLFIHSIDTTTINSARAATTQTKSLRVSNAARFSVHPNPSDDFITMTLVNQKGGTLNIYNMLGEKIMQIELIAGVQTYRIDISELSNGVYFASLSNAEYPTANVLKFIKNGHD